VPDICTAIRDRRVVEFSYEGGARRVDPYCYGRRGDAEVVYGYLHSAYGVAPDEEGWTTFDAGVLSALDITSHEFTPRPEFGSDVPLDAQYCSVR
jgi:hypothetical protein